MSPWLWAIAALVIALSELHTPGSYLIWIGLGAGITALAVSIADLSLGGQVGIFMLATILSCIAGYFVYQKRLEKQHFPLMNERARTIVGTRGVVARRLEHGKGKVALGDTVWLAEGPDLSEGTPVIVTRVKGTTLIVEGTSQNPAA
jgi:membrane protein implicated in regulation of membrane protease activity